MRLYVQNLTVTRAEKTVLNGVSFTTDKPELIGVIGPNGVGKTTMMRALLGLQECRGDIHLDGQDLHQMSSDLRARSLAYLPQERSLHWPLSCFDVVLLGRLPHQPGFGRASKLDRDIAAAVMKEMDVTDFADRPFDQISGGEQARVLIARILAQQTDILIADEPTSGLDPAHQIDLMGIFASQVAAGKTVITSLHDLPLASRWCDRLLVLKEGRLMADGAPDDILTDGLMADIFSVTTGRLTLEGRQVVVPLQKS